MKVLAALALILIILAQSFTDGFCGYLGNLKKWGNSIQVCGLRDASASKIIDSRVMPHISFNILSFFISVVIGDVDLIILSRPNRLF